MQGDFMSVYYVVGSDVEINNVNELHLGFEEIKNLNEIVKDYNFDKKFYYVSDPVICELGYDVRNSSDFNLDPNKEIFNKFIEFLKTNITNLEFYKLWSIFDGDNELNEIYYQKTYNLKNYKFAEDYFKFDFNTKYVFENK